MSASLIGRLRSSASRLSTTAASASLAGSCFSSDSAQGPCMGLFESSRATHFRVRHSMAWSKARQRAASVGTRNRRDKFLSVLSFCFPKPRGLGAAQ
jgi:hypothetical protein